MNDPEPLDIAKVLTAILLVLLLIVVVWLWTFQMVPTP